MRNADEIQLYNIPKRSGWRTLRLMAIVAFLFLTCGPSVIAENIAFSSTFFLQERQVKPLQRLGPRPTRTVSAAVRAPRRTYVPNWSQQPAREIAPPANTPPKPVITPIFFVSVFGDSLGVLMAQGLQDAYGDRPEIAVARRARESSGLVRDDFFDWPKAVTELLAGSEKVDVAVMIIGSNDRQEMPDKTNPIAFRTADGNGISPEFRAAYSARVQALAEKFRDRRIPLIWVGMPVVKNDRMSAELGQLNEIYRDNAMKAGAIYVDIWEAFTNDAGKFDAFGPDLNGEVVKLRSADGIHFTKAGARKLAHFVESEIKRVFDQAKPAHDPILASLPANDTPVVPAAPVGVNAAIVPPQNPQVDSPEPDINAILRRQIASAGLGGDAAPALAKPEQMAALPLPAETAPLYLPMRPLAGPVVLLTSPPLSQGGELLGRKAARPVSNDAQALIDQAFVNGQLAKARPGRADDFSWPRR